MGRFVVGEVVVVKFPFSDLKGSKLRPALVLARGEFNNFILCQITSKKYASRLAIEITEADFNTGGLPVRSYARPDKLFTADPGLIQKTAGRLLEPSLGEILAQVRSLFSGR